MNKNKCEQLQSTNLDYIVPGLPFYSSYGEYLAEKIYDFFEFLSDVVSRRKKKIEEV